MKEKYKIWASHLLEELMLAPRQQRESILSSHLEKAHQRGYRDAVANDWWRQQEAAPSKPQEEEPGHDKEHR